MICGERLNTNRKEGEPLWQACNLHYDHTRYGRDQEKHVFENKKKYESKIIKIYKMNKIIDPNIPILRNRLDNEFISLSDDVKDALAVKVLSMSKAELDWSNEKRLEFLNRFGEKHSWYLKNILEALEKVDSILPTLIDDENNRIQEEKRFLDLIR
jgi:hypothetical protein